MKTELKGIDAKVAIHCTTPELYTQVLDLFPINAEERKLMDFGFDEYGNETCIADYGLFYGRIDFWKSEGYTIITAAEFIAMNTEPESDSKIVGADMICPITKKHCDDECYTIGSECNMSGDEISNTEPEPAPAWSFKTDEELKNFVATFLATKGDFEQFLSSLRRPAFELICQDGVVTDPEQRVYYVEGMDICGNLAQFAPKDLTCFTTESAALEHRRHNTPAFELITADNVKVTDKNQGVWIINGEQIVQYDAFFVGTRQCFSTRDAAISHIRNTAKVLCLDDWGPHNLLRKDVAEHLVNERIK